MKLLIKWNKSRKIVHAFFFLCFISFKLHALPLSSKTISINSQDGMALLIRSLNENYIRLSAQFVTQKNKMFCGVASIVMVLNAFEIQGPMDAVYLPYKLFTQDNFFDTSFKKNTYEKQIMKRGLVLDEIKKILEDYPINVTILHSNELTLEKFRGYLIEAVANKDTFCILNYSYAKLGQEGRGHYSPVAAYDNKTDRFLILDVARYKYPPVWVNTEDLWEAVNTLADSKLKKWRGIAILKKGIIN